MYHRKSVLLPGFPMQNENRARIKPTAICHSSPHGAGKAPGAPGTQQGSFGSLLPLGTWQSEPAPERGHTGNVLVALPRQRGWTPRAPLFSSARGWVCNRRLSPFCSGDGGQIPSWCPSCRVRGDPSAHAAAPGPSSPCCSLRAARPAPCSRARSASLSRAANCSDERHKARRTHVSHNLNHLRAF